MSNNLRAVAMVKKPELLMNEGKSILVSFCAEEQRAVPMSEAFPEMRANMGEDGVSAQSEENEETVMAYDVYTVRVEQPISRDKIADTIIQSAYPVDKMQALINNYNLGKEDEDYDKHLAEYDEMQQFRKLAKQVAKDVIAEYTEKYCK